MDREQEKIEKPLTPLTLLTPKELAIIIKQTSIVVIKMSASWCSPCQNKIFLESYHKLKLYYSQNKKVKFIELDVDDDLDIIENNKYYDIDVKAIPTFLISKNGSFIRKFEGCGYLNEIDEFIYNNVTNIHS